MSGSECIDRITVTSFVFFMCLPFYMNVFRVKHVAYGRRYGQSNAGVKNHRGKRRNFQRMASIPNNILDLAVFGNLHWKRSSSGLYSGQEATQLIHIQVLWQPCIRRPYHRLVRQRNGFVFSYKFSED